MDCEMNCLIVDDDPMFAMVAEGILSTLTKGKIGKATSGRDGLQRLKAMVPAPDLVFLDLNMPDIDGLAFMRAASEFGFGGSIAISSGENPAILRSAEAMGKMLGISLAGVLRKPLTVDAVSSALERASSAARQSAPSTPANLIGDGLELTPYYQPQYDLRTGAVVGVEALIRLTARDGRVHGPAEVFKAVNGLADLTDVSLAIARKVLSQSNALRSAPAAVDISINFDASVLEQPEVVAALQQEVLDLGLDPGSICLEITEKSLPKEPSRLVEAATRLCMAGFKLSLDDYGMGASSFELLRLCPFNEIKVDRSITAACTTDHVTRKFLQATAALARDLDLVSVAEGVETEQELEEVKKAGVDRVQGFLFSPPLPLASATQVLMRAAGAHA